MTRSRAETVMSEAVMSEAAMSGTVTPESAAALVIGEAVTTDAAIVAYVGDLTAERLDVVSRRPAPAVADEEAFIAGARAAECAVILSAAGILPHDRHAGHFGMSVAAPWPRGSAQLLPAAIRHVRSWDGFCRLWDLRWYRGTRLRSGSTAGFVHEGRRAKAVNFRGVPEDLLMMVW